jgi:trehalose-phosphatase
VAVLSGRSAADVAGRVRVGGVTYLGNHGMERGFVPRGGRAERLRPHIDDAAESAVHAAEMLAERVPEVIREPWLVVERKPPAVAFHYRTAPDLDVAGRAVRDAVDQLDPEGVLDRFAGRRVLELRPPGAVAKGDAFASLFAELRPRSVFLLGDDVSDAQAFHAFRQLRQAGATDGLAVAVQARSEVPPAVAEAADVVLGSPAEATRFLAAVARRLAQ